MNSYRLLAWGTSRPYTGMYIVLAGLCLGIPFIVPALWFIGFVGGALSLQLVLRAQTWQSALYQNVLVWLVRYICVLSWYVTAYPLEWVGQLSAGTQLIVIAGYWGTSALWLAVGGGVFGLCAYGVRKWRVVPSFLWYVLVPGIWVVSELAGAYFFSIATAGPGSSIQPYFSFGMVGYLFAEISVGVWLAKWIGVYGLSILYMVCAVGLLRLVSYRRAVIVSAIATFLLCLYGVGYVVHTPSSEVGVTVFGVDTQFTALSVATPSGVAEKVAAQTAALDAAVAAHAPYVVFPEESRLMSTIYAGLSKEAALRRFLFTYGNTPTVLIDTGRVDMSDGATYLRSTIFDGTHKQVYQFDKQYLVPQGEFVPYGYGAILRLVGFGQTVDELARDSSYRPGPLSPQETTTVPSVIPGVLFCFESVRPDGVATLLRARSFPFVVHPISHSWFHSPQALWHQLDTMLVLQARTTGVPIVSAGNMVEGALYLPNGTKVMGEVVASGDRWQLRSFSF